MAQYHVLAVTNMWPCPDDPGWAGFVRAQMESLRPFGVDYDLLFIYGRQSRWNYLRAIPELWRRLRKTRYDLIHAHFGLAGCVARCQLFVPVVVTFWGDDVMGTPARSGRITLMGRLFQVSSFVLARLVSATMVQSRQMQAMLKQKSARVLPGGIDLTLFQPMEIADARRELGLDLQKKYVLFPYDPGVERKRFDLIQAAVERAQRTVPNLEVLQVLGVPQSRMPLYFNAAAVFVLASLIEGSPYAVKEALAVNLPVVTVDVGDTVELLGTTEGNYLVPREVEPIAEKIVEVIRRGSRTHSREWIARIAMPKIAEQIMEVYASVVRPQAKHTG